MVQFVLPSLRVGKFIILLQARQLCALKRKISAGASINSFLKQGHDARGSEIKIMSVKTTGFFADTLVFQVGCLLPSCAGHHVSRPRELRLD